MSEKPRNKIETEQLVRAKKEWIDKNAGKVYQYVKHYPDDDMANDQAKDERKRLAKKYGVSYRVKKRPIGWVIYREKIADIDPPLEWVHPDSGRVFKLEHVFPNTDEGIENAEKVTDGTNGTYHRETIGLKIALYKKTNVLQSRVNGDPGQVPSLIEGIEEAQKEKPEKDEGPEKPKKKYDYWRKAKSKAADEYSADEENPGEGDDSKEEEERHPSGIDLPDTVVKCSAKIIKFAEDFYAEPNEPRFEITIEMLFMREHSLKKRIGLKLTQDQYLEFIEMLGVEELYKNMPYAMIMFIPKGTKLDDYLPQEEEEKVRENPPLDDGAFVDPAGQSDIEANWKQEGSKERRKELMGLS